MIAPLLAFASLAQQYPTQTDWQPAKTWAVVVGVLEWQDEESFAPFPKKNRRDALLVEALKSRGVPEKQIIYLQDRQATAKNITYAVDQATSKVGGGGHLIFYYAGHGYMSEGEFCFAAYDEGERGVKTSAPKLIEAINRRFSGNSVWLLADCCYSGQLSRIVKKLPQLPATVTASASPTIESTGNWTFSDVVVDGLNGMAYVDLNRNGKITLAEITDTIFQDMKFAEKQKTENHFTAAFGGNSTLVEAKKASGKRVGQRVVVKWEGQDYKARIIEEKDGKFLVRWFGYDADEESWVAPEEIVRVWK